MIDPRRNTTKDIQEIYTKTIRFYTHHRLIVGRSETIYKILKDNRVTKIIGLLRENRRFFVVLEGKRMNFHGGTW